METTCAIENTEFSGVPQPEALEAPAAGETEAHVLKQCLGTDWGTVYDTL